MSSQLQNLSNQFNSLLTQYTDTYQNYISIINSDTNSLTTVPNSSFVGDSNISVLNNSSVSACQSSCTSNSSCSGATFNNNSNSCTLSSGNGNIIPASQSTAIVQEALSYSYQLQKINTQLLNINQQIMTASTNSYSEFQETQQQNQQQEQVLQNNYQTLTQERLQIDEMIRQFETINAAYENGNINVTANYYSYIVLVIVAVFLIFVLIKYSIPSQQMGGGNNLNFGTNQILIYLLLGAIIVFNSFIKK